LIAQCAIAGNDRSAGFALLDIVRSGVVLAFEKLSRAAEHQEIASAISFVEPFLPMERFVSDGVFDALDPLI
jgi:hypothetical protein